MMSSMKDKAGSLSEVGWPVGAKGGSGGGGAECRVPESLWGSWGEAPLEPPRVPGGHAESPAPCLGRFSQHFAVRGSGGQGRWLP